MKIKAEVAVLLAIFLLSSIAMMSLMPVKASSGPTLTLSNAELNDAFLYEWGPGTLTAKSISASPSGVEFDFTGLASASDTGVGNNWPINPEAGGAGPEYCDFSAYTRYTMLFTNIGTDPVQVCLFMNTGFDGNPNVYWASTTVTISSGQSQTVTIDFSSSYKSVPGGGSTTYWGLPVQNLNQVSNIGFQVWCASSGAEKIVVSGLTGTLLYTNPANIQKAPSDVSSTFKVSVTLENFANLMGFDIQLTWDNSLITYVSSDTTPLNALWPTWDIVYGPAQSAGSYELAATSISTAASNTGASVLFTLTFQVTSKTSNFQLSTPITFAVVKLSDNSVPVPQPIPATVTNGTYYMSSTPPDLEFQVEKYATGSWNLVSSPYDFECTNLFTVDVYVTDISANSPLQGYDVKIAYDPSLVACQGVLTWGPFGTGTFNNVTGVADVSASGTFSGSEELLFRLEFEVEFTATANHIWKYGNANYMTFQVSIASATLSFGSLGSIPISGITTPSPLTIEVGFIRGDVDCNGVVNLADISDIAYYYNKASSARPEYDLNNNGFIDIYDIVTAATNFGYTAQ